jgi:hypothetical protein
MNRPRGAPPPITWNPLTRPGRPAAAASAQAARARSPQPPPRPVAPRAPVPPPPVTWSRSPARPGPPEPARAAPLQAKVAPRPAGAAHPPPPPVPARRAPAIRTGTVQRSQTPQPGGQAPPLTPVTGALVLHQPSTTRSSPQQQGARPPRLRVLVSLPSPIPRSLLRFDPGLEAPTGLADPGMLARYSSMAAALHVGVSSGQASIEDGVRLLSEILRDMLREVDVPVAPTLQMSRHMTAQGSFGPLEWVTRINEKGLSLATLIELFDTLYHETRHAEQFFRVARYLAGRGLGAREIAQLTDIPEWVAAEAVRNPLFMPDRGWTPETLQAVRWYHALAGSGASHRRSVLTRHNPYDLPLTLGRMEWDRLMQEMGLAKRKVVALDQAKRALAREARDLRAFAPDPDAPPEQQEEHRKLVASHLETQRQLDERGREIARESQRITARGKELLAELTDLIKKHVTYAEGPGQVYHDDYLDLPEEVDAWEVGGLAGASVRGLVEPMQRLVQLFDPGEATGIGNNCLLDSLDQLVNDRQETDMGSVENMRLALSGVFPQLRGRMLDIYGAEGDTLAQNLNIRIRVVQIVGGTMRVHNVLLGNPGARIVHVLHTGLHFTPLFLKPGRTDADVLRLLG